MKTSLKAKCRRFNSRRRGRRKSRVEEGVAEAAIRESTCSQQAELWEALKSQKSHSSGG